MIAVASPSIGKEEQDAVARVLSSGMVAQGPEVEAFEDEFSDVVGGAQCVAVNSGTSALHLGLLAAGIGPGDEVIVPSFTFAATGNSVVLAGATPVFVDIDSRSYCLDPAAVEGAIGPRTAAIMPVHLYGQAANMDALQTVAERHHLAIFEDAAQAHMASWQGRPVGSIGGFGAFSFYPTKNMTSGEGGMITTSEPEIARRARLLRNQGMEKRYANELVGFNARMTDVHAAIGRVQLRHLEDWTVARQRNAQVLDDALSDAVGTPWVAREATHVYHQYTIRVDRRNEFQRVLESKGVGSGIYYPTPTHLLPSFGLSDVSLPNTDQACEEVLSLPVHPRLTDADLGEIINAVLVTAAELGE